MCAVVTRQIFRISNVSKSFGKSKLIARFLFYFRYAYTRRLKKEITTLYDIPRKEHGV